MKNKTLKKSTITWEQQKFGNIVQLKRGLTYSPNDIDKNGIRVLRSSNIVKNLFSINADDVFVKHKAINIEYANNGDILITAANGSSKLVGKHAIIQGILPNKAVHGGFMLIGVTKFSSFINASMHSNWYRDFISKFSAGGNGAIGNLNKNDLSNQCFYIPAGNEQQQIGTFFSKLDNLITFHQRREKRKNYHIISTFIKNFKKKRGGHRFEYKIKKRIRLRRSTY